MNENLVKERVNEFLRTQNISTFQFAKHIGVQPQSVTEWLTEGKTIGKIVYNMIYAYPDLSTEWLFRGTGDMFIKNNNPTVGLDNEAVVINGVDWSNLDNKTLDFVTNVINAFKSSEV